MQKPQIYHKKIIKYKNANYIASMFFNQLFN